MKDNIKILLVKDPHLKTSETKKSIQSLGYKIAGIAETLDQAIGIIKDNNPNLVLIDSRIKTEQNRVIIADRLKEKYDLPVVFLVTLGDLKNLLTIKSSGPFDFLTKPFKNLELMGTIETALHKHTIKQKFQKSKEQYRLLADKSNDIIWTLKINKNAEIENVRLEFVSPSIERITGFSLQEIKQGKLDDFIAPESMRLVKKNFREAINQEINGQDKVRKILELEHLCKDGSIVWMESNMSFLYDENNIPTGIIGVSRDITERKKIEENLKRSEQNSRTLLKASHDAVYLVDCKGILCETNQDFVYNISRKKMIGKNIFKSMSKNLASHRRAMLDRVIHTREPINFQDKRAERYFDSNLYPIFDKNGNVIRVAVFAKDITEQKSAENKILNLLQEKELLLKEVHHRIKNNMNTLKSMFSLQADASENPDIKGILHVAMNRVTLMSKIYEQLYRKTDIQNINIRSVINDLMVEIKETYELSHPCDITFEIEIENILIGAKQSFPLGIIVNELVTNAFKYAFPDRKKGKITLSIAESDSKNLEVKISDNGIGIPEKIIRNKSYGFGLELVTIFTKQYKGDFTINRNKGTSVKVRLKKESE